MSNPFVPTPSLRTVEQLIQDFAGPLPEQLKMVNLIYSLGQPPAPQIVTWADVEDKPATFPATSDSVESAVAAKTEIAALVAPTEDFADLTEATAAVAAIINALKA